MNLNKAFALRISKLLAERKMSKYRLEKLAGISHTTMRYIFNEVNKEVKFSTIVKIAEAFGLTMSEFFDDDVFKYENLDF